MQWQASYKAQAGFSKLKLNGTKTRIAPSPTGDLHLGHSYHLQALSSLASTNDLKVILRMEDHDLLRSKPEYEQKIMGRLQQILPFDTFEKLIRVPATRDRHSNYLDVLAFLIDERMVFKCECTRKRRNEFKLNPANEFIYDGKCSHRKLTHIEEATTSIETLRLDLPECQTAVSDVLLGNLTQNVFDFCRAPVLRDRNQQWSYFLTNTIDDIQQGVDTIIRGHDLWLHTPRQVLFRKILGFTNTPTYLHHPILLDENGAKFSKRDGSKWSDIRFEL